MKTIEATATPIDIEKDLHKMIEFESKYKSTEMVANERIIELTNKIEKSKAKEKSRFILTTIISAATLIVSIVSLIIALTK